jgi:hypothetical protein
MTTPFLMKGGQKYAKSHTLNSEIKQRPRDLLTLANWDQELE